MTGRIANALAKNIKSAVARPTAVCWAYGAAVTSSALALNAILTGKMAYARRARQAKPVTEPESLSLDTSLAAALTECTLIECNQRTVIVQTSTGEFAQNTLLLDHIHIADRPQFLLKMASEDQNTQEILLRIRANTGPYFVLTDIKMQKRHGSVFMSLRPTKAILDQMPFTQAARELAHELRTPLAAMVGLADALAQAETCTNQMRAAYPAMISQAGRDLIALTTTMLDDSASNPNSETDDCNIELAAVVNTCVELMRTSAKQKGITLFNRLQVALGGKMVSNSVLRQILTNLISNAVKFSPAGASVEINASACANGWALSVTDNGGGMLPEDVARLGQKNFRAAKTSGTDGHGLGLSIVQRLVDEIGAQISFESRPGKGTKVQIKFNASAPVELADYRAQAVADPIQQSRFDQAAGAKHAAA